MVKDDLKKKGVEEFFKYPLMEAIFRRRSRRFPAGATLTGTTFAHASKEPPTPLSDLETAILCYVASGVTGAATCETLAPKGNSITSWVGKATPNPCNTFTTKLFFSNDEGTFLYDPKEATKAVEIQTEADREKIIDQFKNSTIKVQDGRVEMFPMELHRTIMWNTNQPGTTIFIPIVDNTEQFLNWLSMVLNEEYGYQLYDDIKGTDAGLKRFKDNGDLKGPVIPLSSFEDFMWKGIILAPAYLMSEHIHLVAEAMGLGSVMFGGYTGEVMLGVTPSGKGLGFRGVKDKSGKINAVGLDGIYEAYCPPYYKNMDAAVEAFFEKKFGRNSLFGEDYMGIVPFKEEAWKTAKPKYLNPSQKVVDMVKAFCNYIYDTYGRVPSCASPKSIPVWMQVHHAELEFYEKFYAEGTIHETHRRHFDVWHK